MKFFVILKQIWGYARVRKKYWLLPFAIILIALAVIIITAQGSVIAPFIYTIF
tara:strand:- start:5879 stop:6037 length:159 start_codon:yes stop_codon:yes gene_type:complete